MFHEQKQKHKQKHKHKQDLSSACVSMVIRTKIRYFPARLRGEIVLPFSTFLPTLFYPTLIHAHRGDRGGKPPPLGSKGRSQGRVTLPWDSKSWSPTLKEYTPPRKILTIFA